MLLLNRFITTQIADIPVCSAADNVAFYAHNSVPFVVGTTGGDREKLMQDAKAGNAYAVIAPQMGKQVSASQAHCPLTFVH